MSATTDHRTDPADTRERPTPWATQRLGYGLHHVDSPVGAEVPDLVEPGLRRNPRRAHLLVSTVLGKHLPTPPGDVIAAADRLGDLVLAALGDAPDTDVPAGGRDLLVLGFAETATGLGHCVADRLRASYYLHSTRRGGARTHAEFEEGHSHATRHQLQPADPARLHRPAPLVLVDDEISTGATALDAIGALHALAPRAHYVVASLVDMRTAEHRRACADAAAALGVRIDHVALATGRTELPPTLVADVLALPDPPLNPRGAASGTVTRIDLPWPTDVPDGGRFGFEDDDRPRYAAAVTTAATLLAAELDPSRPVIVVGHEELMHLPLRLADALEGHHLDVRFQTTTRSPAYVVDAPGYPLRRGFTFPAPEEGEDAPRYLYNAALPDAAAQARLVLVVDAPADTPRLAAPGGLLDVLTAAGDDVLLAVLPGTDQAAVRDRGRTSAELTDRSAENP